MDENATDPDSGNHTHLPQTQIISYRLQIRAYEQSSTIFRRTPFNIGVLVYKGFASAQTHPSLGPRAAPSPGEYRDHPANRMNSSTGQALYESCIGEWYS